MCCYWVLLQLFTLDGAAYDARFLCDAGRAALAAGGPDAVDAELDTCALLSNNKGQPLLAAYTGGQQDGLGKLIANMSVSAFAVGLLHVWSWSTCHELAEDTAQSSS